MVTVLAAVAAGLVGLGSPVDGSGLSVPRVGDHGLRVLSEDHLELWLITAGKPGPPWQPANLEVRVAGAKVPIVAMGLRRRASSAPLKPPELRAGNSVYLRLATPIPAGAQVEVIGAQAGSSAAALDSAGFTARNTADRQSTAIHVDQLGYALGGHKRASIGAMLGTLGELPIAATTFTLVDEQGGEAFRGPLAARPDQAFAAPLYRLVKEADFTAFDKPGRYRLQVPGLGRSLPFAIGEGLPAAIARTYAAGLYVQRCGDSVGPPFTRFRHGACHVAPAAIPDDSFKSVGSRLAGNAKSPGIPLVKPSASLYPFVREGAVDVAGGHHDAGDYGKYATNSAELIHSLVFAADAFPGAAALDNLGLPESGDGKSDLLQIALREADFLAKLQDDDGGFAFLVQPRDRTYETNVPPERGDRQVIFPKSTVSTAAAVAALAQAASSPAVKKSWPAAAARYLAAAERGWQFLERALAAHGKDAHQKVTHYGELFGHDDELAWAAVELYLLTGRPALHDRVRATLDTAVRHWGFNRLPGAYGNGIRSYAFAARTKRRAEADLDPDLLRRCRAEVIARGADLAGWARSSAYGASVPPAARRLLRVGWYFSGERGFDLTAAFQLAEPAVRRGLAAAVTEGFDFELGGNPLDLSFLAGTGWRRARELVSQQQHNERQALPPSGIFSGSVQEGFRWLHPYGRAPMELSLPSDADHQQPYPLYDRYTDGFNLGAEATVAAQGRALAAASFWMASSALAGQPWRAASARIEGLPAKLAVGATVELKLVAEGLDLSGPQAAQIVWEASEGEPVFGDRARFTASRAGPVWIEAEAMLPDGRRVFAAAEAVAE